MSHDDLRGVLYAALARQAVRLDRLGHHSRHSSDAHSNGSESPRDHYGEGNFEKWLASIVESGQAAESLLTQLKLSGEERKRIAEIQEAAKSSDSPSTSSRAKVNISGERTSKAQARMRVWKP